MQRIQEKQCMTGGGCQCVVHFPHLVVYALMVDLAGDEVRRHKGE